MTIQSFGASSEEVEGFGIRLAMAFGGCRHEQPIPVESVTGELVAALCTDCDMQLPPGFGCIDCAYVEIPTFESATPYRVLTETCRAHGR